LKPSSPAASCLIVSSEAIIAARIGAALAQSPATPLLIGLCGAQGSGKSTLAQALAARFPHMVVLSLDDFYLTRAERIAHAEREHPLFVTRGVPGTHDIGLALATLDALHRGEPVALPRFDKAIDDRAPKENWPRVTPPYDLILLEGWCVGAVPQGEAELAAPINALERIEDADGRWRTAVNAALAGAYQELFGRLDLLFLLAAPDWQTVGLWREEQEARLREAVGEGPGVMDAAGVARFIQHYERLTRHILDEMPRRADLVLHLAPDRSCRRIERSNKIRLASKPISAG
jgi:D-glycerate 3-kinase